MYGFRFISGVETTKKIRYISKNSAKMAQLAERHTRNVQVRGSIPRLGSRFLANKLRYTGN